MNFFRGVIMAQTYESCAFEIKSRPSFLGLLISVLIG